MGDFAKLAAPSFESCFNLCTQAQNGQCGAFSYWQSNCYLKQLLNDGRVPQNSADSNMAWIVGAHSSSTMTTKASTSTSTTTGTYSPTGKALTGFWGPLINFPTCFCFSSLHCQNRKLLMWSSDGQFSFGSGTTTYFADYDWRSGASSQRVICNTNHNVFCPGISMDAKGRVIVTGGSTSEKTSIYDPSSTTFSSGPNMNIPRGYQATAALSNGTVFSIGGSWSGGHGGKNGEVFVSSSNRWVSLPQCSVSAILTQDTAGIYRQDNHAWLFGWKNGAVFHAGSSKQMTWFGTSNGGTIQSAGNRGNAQDAMNGNAVMWDAGQILTLGGANNYENSQALTLAHLVSINTVGSAPTVQQVGSLKYPRAMINSVVLPNGEVIVLGGMQYTKTFNDDNPTLYPELWSSTTKSWRILQASEAFARAYHAVALLIPDGTVFSGGGGLCGSCSVNHPDGQIFTPPYLYRGDSLATPPTINSVDSSTYRAGQQIKVNVSVTYDKQASFSLIRHGSATYTVNTDQRRIALTVASKNGNAYVLNIPNDYGTVLPGIYYLFATDAGVPSYAKNIQIGL